MENPELLLLEIEEYNRNTNCQDHQIPQNLENYIEFVSKTGKYVFPWNLVKKIFLKKLNNIINSLQTCMSTSDLNTSSSSNYMTNQYNDLNNTQLIKERIIDRMKSFTSAPFTIQRICELLLKPNAHYNRIDKYLRGLEKCIMVVTTVDPNGNKIFMETFLTNGISSNPSTPLITPTRPTTPPETHTDTANGSLIFPPPTKVEDSEDNSNSTEVSSTSNIPTSNQPESDAMHTDPIITESLEQTEQTITTEKAVENIQTNGNTVNYESESLEIKNKFVSVETSSANVHEVKLEVTDMITSSVDMTVSTSDMTIADEETGENISVKTAEVLVTTSSTVTEPEITAEITKSEEMPVEEDISKNSE